MAYGTSSNSLTTKVFSDWITEVTREDLCDGDFGAPASLGGFTDLGMFINVPLFNLKPGTTYFYEVCDDNAYSTGCSQIFNFTSNPSNGPTYGVGPSKSTNYSTPINFVAFGDMGNVPIDFSYHHSWDNYNHGEIYSINTTHTISDQYMTGPAETSDFLVHIGDISYAVGFTTEWDDYMHQTSPIANFFPYMTGIGNHEFSWSGEWKPPPAQVDPDAYGNADSGGECGVPYNSFYPFSSVNPLSKATPLERLPYYSFSYGPIYIIIMSTEHDFSQGSDQYKWLDDTLTSVDRSIFPWIFFFGHRPMYVPSTWDGDLSTGSYLVSELEELLVNNNVAFAGWGHYHAYGRSCPVQANKCHSKGIVHVVMGMAGYHLTSTTQAKGGIWEASTNEEYGFMHFSVKNDSILVGKFVNCVTQVVSDSFTVSNPYMA